MNYDILKDWELSRHVFYTANPDTELVYSSVRSEILGSVTVQNFNGSHSEIFSVFNFEDIMPIVVKHGIGYELEIGGDYKPDMYKAICVENTGFHNFTTRDRSLFRALAICYLKVNEYLTKYHGELPK